jgi:SAM-dependent methyltransferase
MPVFSIPRKQAQQLARQFLAGHCSLMAWWTLRHAGVLDAMLKLETEKKESLDPLVYATRTNMSPEILAALLEYLVTAGVVVKKKDGMRLSADGHALLDHEDGVLELARAYQPMLDMAEHMLAKLKSYGGGVIKKSEYLVNSQAKRYAAEVVPAVTGQLIKHKLWQLLDLTCGSGDLLVDAAQNAKRVVGVGIGSDGLTVRRANDAITKADLEKRLIAVTANPFDVATDTQRTFERIGISRQLWKSIDGLIATNLFSELTGRPEEVERILSGIPRNFSGASLILVEAVASRHFDKNYYAPELTLMLRLASSSPWTPEKWREVLAAANYKIVEEESLATDGLMIFVCKPG